MDSDGPVRSGATITVTCNKDYGLIGSATLTCSGTSYMEEVPICQKKGGLL